MSIPPLLLLLAAGCSSPPSGNPSAGGATEAKGGDTTEITEAIHVEFHSVQPRILEDVVVTTGELRADEEVELRSEEEGRIVGLHFEEGTAVRQGQLLVEINDASQRAELRRVEVRRDLASRREQRSRTLLSEKTVSQDVYDEDLGELQALDAQIEVIRANLAKTKIYAPFSGVVGLRHVSVGSYVSTATLIATLHKLDPIKIDFSVPEKYASRIQLGQEVTIRVAGTDDSIRGRVYAIEPRIDSDTRTIQLRAEAPNVDKTLIPGAFAEIELVLGTFGSALTIPSIALVASLEQTVVYVEEDGRAVQRRVEVGIRTGKVVQITSGLAAGDRVIVSGIQQIKPGTEVIPMSERLR